MPHGFMNPAEAATPRFMRAGNVLRFARSPWPPAPYPPPRLGLALGLKSYLSQVSAGPLCLEDGEATHTIGGKFELIDEVLRDL